MKRTSAVAGALKLDRYLQGFLVQPIRIWRDWSVSIVGPMVMKRCRGCSNEDLFFLFASFGIDVMPSFGVALRHQVGNESFSTSTIFHRVYDTVEKG